METCIFQTSVLYSRFKLWFGGIVIATAPDIAGTRERLLEAAGEVFARQGFRSATVREICSRAGVNIAAVNYYFRDKQRLYAAVLQYAQRYAIETYPPTGGLDDDATAEQRLDAYVRSFLRRLTNEGRPAWHGLLMIREIAEPTEALDELVEQSFKPLYDRLTAIIVDVLGPHASPERIRFCASSIVGQCMHFQVSREVLRRLNPDLRYDTEGLDAIARHVVRFSLGALKSLRNGKSQTIENEAAGN